MSVPIETVFGVDFSGAKLAGRNAWVARCELNQNQLRVASLDSLEKLVGTAERDAALAGLIALIRGSDAALWALDFPFGLPIELGLGTWRDQLRLVKTWKSGASDFGHHCLAIARATCDRQHVRRRTDVEQRTPFDCYHYRIIYQTFHGMRDVLGPLAGGAGTCVLPFQTRKLDAARRVVVEACPSSTLKRLGLPHQNYKQPAGGPLTNKRRATRRTLIAALRELVQADETIWRRAMRNPGGDALDAVLAAVGGWHGFSTLDPAAVARHDRYSREGLIFA